MHAQEVSLGLLSDEARSSAGHGAAVIYAQTDSLFAHFPAATKSEAVKLGHAAAAAVSAGFPPEMEIKYEKVCQPFMLLHVNRCAASASNMNSTNGALSRQAE